MSTKPTFMCREHGCPGTDKPHHSSECPLAIPEGLSPEGRRAAETIAAFLIERGLTYTGGCTTFDSPQQWKDRGEDYGRDGVLIVVYDGSAVGRAFSLDRYEYETVEAMRATLATVGVWPEECTCWYSAIYVERPLVQPYTVVGIYTDNDQRTCVHVEASSATDAEVRARQSEEWRDHEVRIAAVFDGHLRAVDTNESGSD